MLSQFSGMSVRQHAKVKRSVESPADEVFDGLPVEAHPAGLPDPLNRALASAPTAALNRWPTRRVAPRSRAGKQSAIIDRQTPPVSRGPPDGGSRQERLCTNMTPASGCPSEWEIPSSPRTVTIPSKGRASSTVSKLPGTRLRSPRWAKAGASS